MPAVCRGDSTDTDVVHCSTPSRSGRSDNVKVNAIGISRAGDLNTSHLLPAAVCVAHTAPITTGSTKVFINGKGCGRIGDAVSSCTVVGSGSPNVFAGG